MSSTKSLSTPVGAGLAAAGLAVFLLCFATRAFYVADDADLAVGMTSVEVCEDDGCHSYGLSYTDFYEDTDEANKSKVFAFLAMIARVVGLGLLGTAAVWVIAAAARRRRTGAAYVFSAIALAELILVIALVWMLPIDVRALYRVTLTRAGIGAYGLMAACAMLAVAGWLLRPAPARRDPDLPPEHVL